MVSEAAVPTVSSIVPLRPVDSPRSSRLARSARSPRPLDGGDDGGSVALPGPGGPARAVALAVRPAPALHAIPSKRCRAGHPNDPEAAGCRLCGEPIEAATAVEDLLPEPLGRLLLEDGSAIELVADLLVGRHPEPPTHAPPPGPTDTLTVPGAQVSRVHFGIEVRGWRLQVRDHGSTNGTFVTRRAERGRRRIPEDRPVPLRIGDTLHFGSRQAHVAPVRVG